jgi:hypothetical protein
MSLKSQILRNGFAALGLFLTAALCQSAQAAEDIIDSDPKALIAELASPEFEVRRLAQEQLQSMGLGAFDALLEAQFNPDVEVAHRARFILRSMAIEWVKESDPKDVKQILRGYAKSDPIDRRSQIEALARLDDQRGVAALCRLSNYEFDPILSKFAALQIMQMDLSEAPQAPKQIVRLIEVHCRPSQRPAALWLAEFAKWLEAPAESLPNWKVIVKEERARLSEGAPNTSREMAGLIFLWYADALRSQTKSDEAIAVLRQTLDFLDPDERQIRDAVIGLIARDAHSVVDELAAQHPVLFKKNPHLCYLHAESLQNRPRKPDEPAPQAQINDLVARAIELGGDRAFVHEEMAQFLKGRGEFTWWERENRIALQGLEAVSPQSKDIRSDLSEMLNELQRFDEAAEALKPVVEAMGNNVDSRRDRALVARYHFFLSRAAAQKSDYSLQRKHLKVAVETFIEDSDVIIDMYRVADADNEWKELTLSYIKEATKEFDEQLKVLENRLAEVQGIDPFRAEYNEFIAINYNQYAWLIANTTGDYDKAIARSKQSLEIFPVQNYSTFQDTLARCYFAKGDYQNAVKYQRLAVKQEPHAPAMRRQLALFEEAARKNQPVAPLNSAKDGADSAKNTSEK